MKVHELINALSTLEDQDMEVVTISEADGGADPVDTVISDVRSWFAPGGYVTEVVAVLR